MDDLCNVQIELTKKPCASDFTFKTQNANYEIGFAFIRNCDVALKFNNLKNAEYFINEAKIYIKSDRNWMLHRDWNLQIRVCKHLTIFIY